MTASHERWQPDESASNLGPIDGLEVADFGDMTELMRIFDLARTEMHLQAARIMLGGGGDTKEEAMDALTDLQGHAVTKFGELAAQIFADEASSDEAIAALATIYCDDEAQRIKILEHAAAEGDTDAELDLERCERTDAVGMLVDTLDTLKEELVEALDSEQGATEATIEPERYASYFADFYDYAVSCDFKKALDYAAPNIAEVHAVNRAIQRDRIVGALAHIGMMAGTSALTILGMVFVEKRRR